MTMGYERPRVGPGRGAHYFVCAECRRLHVSGYRALYYVPQPGRPTPTQEGKSDKQSLCAPCYLAQWARVEPDTPPPDLVDTRLEDYPDPVPWKAREVDPVYKDEFEMWEDALVMARNSGGAETVAHVFARISGASAPDVDVSGPAALETLHAEDTTDKLAALASKLSESKLLL